MSTVLLIISIHKIINGAFLIFSYSYKKKNGVEGEWKSHTCLIALEEESIGELDMIKMLSSATSLWTVCKRICAFYFWGLTHKLRKQLGGIGRYRPHLFRSEL